MAFSDPSGLVLGAAGAILGVYHHPILDDFLIGDNLITEINGSKTLIRNCDDLSKAILLTTDHLNIEKYQKIDKFEQLIKKVKLYRNWGDCYGLLLTGNRLRRYND